jgi:hypothetical protein
MDNIVGIVTIIVGICGIAGFVLSIINANRQEKTERMHAEELKIQAQIQAQEKARSDRLTFLADRIFDSSIPRELRQPFYEEYISMKGNGTAVRFWLLEGEREKKTQ